MLFQGRNRFRLSYLFISCDIILLIIPWVTGDIPYFFAGVFLGTLLLFLYVYAVVSIRYIRIHRSHNSSAVEGEAFYIDTAVANFSYLPVFSLQIDDACLPARTMTIRNILPVTLLPRSVYEYTGCVYITKKMGTYRLGPAEISLTDPLGIFTVHKSLDHITGLVVYPTLNIPERLRLMKYPFLKKIGEEIVPIAGYSADFRGPREYRKGDAKKTVHWRATAKHRNLMVKEFDENGIAEVGIFVDYRRISLRGTGNLTTLALALNTGAAIAEAAVRTYHRFGVSFIGFRNMNDLQFNTGINHLHMVLRSMVSLSRPGRYSSYCREAEKKLALLRPNSTVVFIAVQTTLEAEAFISLAASCRLRRIKPIIVLINDRTFIKVYPEQTDIEKKAAVLQPLKTILETEGASVFILSKKDIPAEVIDAAADVYRNDPDILQYGRKGKAEYA